MLPSDGCHLVREIVVSEGEVEPADQRQPQQGGHLHPVLASSTHPRNGGRGLTEISRLLFMCRLSGYQDTLTSSHHNHNPPSSLTTAHCWSLIPPPLPRIIPVRLLADEERGSSASSTRVAKSCLGTSGCSHQAVCPASFILFLLQSLL